VILLRQIYQERLPVRLHLTNIIGLGAVRLLQSLLPALASSLKYSLKEVYLPTSGEIANFTQFEHTTIITNYVRYLPKSISRLFECALRENFFDGKSPLLVFGDIPIKCRSKQTVFVQTPLLIRGANTGSQLGAVKYMIARWLFCRNIRYVSNFIVQTETMKLALINTYPEINGRIHVIAQPPPSWLIRAQLKRTHFHSSKEIGLRLFYPAATYPHKNHRLLNKINLSASWAISELTLTIPENLNPNPSVSWIRCVDKLQPETVVEVYRTTDALLFLSLSESFGFPLVEAMWIGLPIICPDLPYARTLCGEQAIYFDPHNVDSMQAAVAELIKRRDLGWWPDWSINLEKIPRDWDEVADAMLRIAAS
jgi:hypothetical protein